MGGGRGAAPGGLRADPAQRRPRGHGALIRALSLQKARLGAQRKKLHAAEEAILKEAERELNEEFAYVLGLSLEETPAFIRNLIETDEESEEAFAAHCRMLDRKHMRRAYPISPTGDYMKEKN